MKINLCRDIYRKCSQIKKCFKESILIGKGFWEGSFTGSYTVEAAIVVSITVFVLGAFLIGAFYVHDRSVLQSQTCEAAAVGSIFCTEKERSAAAKEVEKTVTAGRLLGSRGLSGYTAIGSSESRAGWSAVYPIPGFAAKYLAANQLAVSATWTCKIIDPADTIRKIRGASELLMGEDN